MTPDVHRTFTSGIALGRVFERVEVRVADVLSLGTPSSVEAVAQAAEDAYVEAFRHAGGTQMMHEWAARLVPLFASPSGGGTENVVPLRRTPATAYYPELERVFRWLADPASSDMFRERHGVHNPTPAP